jgi:Trypsin-co-occurring domain 1
MTNFVPIEDDKENQVYIEVIPTGNQSSIKQTSKDTGVADKLTADDLKRMIRQAVMPTCQTFVDVWQELNQPLTADSAEVEFNLGFTASGNAVIMQASGQASFKVKVSWKFSPSKDPNLLPVSMSTSNISALSVSTLNTSPMPQGEDFKADLESLESEIKIFKEASKTESKDFNRDEEIEKINRKLKNTTLKLTEQLYLKSKNCVPRPNCNGKKLPENGGCCVGIERIIEDLQNLQSLDKEIGNL